MYTIQIQDFSKEEMKSFIKESVEHAVKDLLPKPVPKINYLTRKETAKKLSISLVTLHNWTRSGVLKGHHINTRVRYKSDEVDRALREIEYKRR